MLNGCFRGTVGETLPFQLLHASHPFPRPLSLMPFSAQSILDGALEGWPEPGPNGNLGGGR